MDSVEDREDISQFPMFDDIDGLQDLSMPVKHSRSPSHTLNTFDQEMSHHQPHMLCKSPFLSLPSAANCFVDQNQGHRLTPQERTRRLSILTARGIQMQSPAVLTSSYFPSFQPTNEAVLPNFVPALPNRILAEDLAFLQKKGALLIPETSLRNELLRCYVQYVHPYLPLLELDEFLTAIQKDDGSSTVSLLLFQAAMFAATAYIDMRYLHSQGYDTRKAARKAFFSRVKLLYDFDYEVDRVIVVQSVLLMTYWYESPDDPKDVWHWLGVAISLARTIGLNCNTAASPLSLEKQKLWKRIWWCCYIRDRLVAIGMRRPIRISEEDHDVPMLEISDFETQPLEAELNRMIGGCSAVRDSSKRELLARMCIAMVRCCQCITRVLSAQYSMLGHRLGATQETTMRLVPRKAAADPAEVTKCDRELEQWYEDLPVELRYFKNTTPREQNVQNDGEVLNLHRALLTGVYLTTTSALHRPQMMPAMPHLIIAPELKELSKRRVREAASAITDVFRDLYSRDLIRFLPNTGVTILLPAIIVHLLDIKSPDSATRQLSVRRFQFCMQALQKLRDMYASADFAFSFLDAAIRKADVPVHDGSHNHGSPQSHNPTFYRAPTTMGSKIHERTHSTALTPPPEQSSMQQVHSPGSDDSNFINPQAIRRDSFMALTPPSSDKMPHMSEVAMTGGAAVSLVDMNHMHHSPNSSIHDEAMGVDCTAGYVEADKLIDYENNNMVDEEAMENDFDQLINLEGGGGVDAIFSDSLVGAADDSSGGALGSVCGDGNFWDGMTMPVLEDEDMTPPIMGAPAHDLPEEAVERLGAAMSEAKCLREQITEEEEGDDHDRMDAQAGDCMVEQHE